jgi:DNA polymerase-1
MELSWINAYETTERPLAEILAKQEQHGWLLDVDAAFKLVDWLLEEQERLSAQILPYLPPVLKKGKPLHEIFLKVGGYKKYVLSWMEEQGIDPESKLVGGPFTRLEYAPPSLGSMDQIKSALYTIGWEPDEWNYKKDPKTKKLIRDDKGNLIQTSPKITESSLENIPHTTDWGSDLVRLLQVQARLKFFVEKGYDADDEEDPSKGLLSHIRSDNTVSSEVVQCGANTGRGQHRKVANVPRPSSFLGAETRGLFIARPGCSIVGTDYGALESRIMAHAIYEYTLKAWGKGDTRFLETILSVDDLHTYLWDDLRDLISSRTVVKTINYAFPYGAQPPKLGSICDLKPPGMSNVEAGNIVLEVMKDKFPGLVETRDATIEQAKSGFVPGLDGRKIYTRSAHSAFNAKIQGWGAIVVKQGMIIRDRLIKENGILSQQVGWYHDEWQAEAVNGYEEAEVEMSQRAVAESGTFFNLSCPMVGESKIGQSWAETH